MFRATSLAAVLAVGLANPAWGTPLRSLPDLQVVRVWEITFSTVANDFTPNAAAISTRLANPLSATNNDFTFFDQEYYDVFYSDADGTPNLDGAYVTIEGVWRSAGGPGGMNINEVALVFGGSTPGVVYADFVASFVYGTGNVIPGSEALAVDHDLGTFPRFGNTSTIDLNDRFRLTVGWDAYSVPEPGALALSSVGALGLLYAGRRRRREDPRGARRSR
jgi:hypothetical protein